MKIKKLTSVQRAVAMIASTLIVTASFLILSQIYFSYIEGKEASNDCYDKGGFPTIEKSGLKIETFDCDMN